MQINDNEWIPNNSEITNVHIISGKGSANALRVAKILANTYNVDECGWSKMVGKIKSDKYIFDVHWYSHDYIGQVEFKIKYFSKR